MKKNIWLYMLLTSILLGSCRKFLDTDPTSFLSPEEYYSTDNIETALGGVYNTITHQNVYGSYYWSTLRATTDEHFYGGGRTITTGIDIYNFTYGDSKLNGFWSTLYTGVERANELLKYIDTTGSDNMKAIYGEALFLRGYFYFLLVSNFGDVPLRLESPSGAENLSLARSSTQEVYAQIVKDMTTADSLVYAPEHFGTSTSRVSKTTVEGILARVCLTMAGDPLKDESQYTNALNWANKVINYGYHKLNSDYRQIFINEAEDVYDNTECLWEADFYYDANSTAGANGQGWVGSYNGIKFTSSATTNGSYYIYQDSGYCYSFLWATKELFNRYSIYDYRKNWNLGSFAYNVYSSNPGSVYRTAIADTFKYDRPIAKWRRTYENRRPLNKNISSINFPLLRYSDVLLMKAEAEFHLNGSSKVALDAINAVRERGYGLTLPNGPPAKILTLEGAGSGYSASFGVGDDNRLHNLAYKAIVSSGKITSLTLLYGGFGYSDGQVVTLGNQWYPNYYYANGTQVVYNGNLYTVSGAGITSSVAPSHTSGSSSAASTGVVFAYAGTAATAKVTTITKADVDLTSLTLLDIQDERFRELCGEGVRATDLLRWGLFIKNLQNEAELMSTHTSLSVNTNKAQNMLGFLNVGDRNLLFPIPSSEISVNKLCTQNPGW